jgi:tetratricopeptide (TPR) repeat protein
MSFLGPGLRAAGRQEEAITVLSSLLDTMRRDGTRYTSREFLTYQGNLANCYDDIGRFDEALDMRRKIYAVSGDLLHSLNIVGSLLKVRSYKEAREFSRRQVLPRLNEVGANHLATFNAKLSFTSAILSDIESPRKDLREAEALLDELVPKLKRVLGDSHPYTQMGITNLQTARVRVKVATENPNQKVVMVRRY